MGRLTNSSTNGTQRGQNHSDAGVCWMWRRKSFLSAMLQRILQRSTAGRPQLRGLTETGEQCTPRFAIRPMWPLFRRRRGQLLLHCQCAMGTAGKLIRAGKL